MTKPIRKRKKGLGPEDIIHKHFAQYMNRYEALNRLDCIFWSYDASGEYRKPATGSLLKAKGLKPGKSDFQFIKREGGVDHYIYIEFKRPKIGSVPAGEQSDFQKDFEQLFEGSVNSRYYLAYSVDEALKILEKEGILKLS